jgi:hypothetical protein
MILASRVAEKPEQYATLAAELVGLKEDVIVVRSGLLAFVAKQATSTIPSSWRPQAMRWGRESSRAWPAPAGTSRG